MTRARLVWMAVGNSYADGNLDTIDLGMAGQDHVATFAARVTASAPPTAVHTAVATIGDTFYSHNIGLLTMAAEPLRRAVNEHPQLAVSDPVYAPIEGPSSHLARHSLRLGILTTCNEAERLRCHLT